MAWPLNLASLLLSPGASLEFKGISVGYSSLQLLVAGEHPSVDEAQGALRKQRPLGVPS